MYISIWIEDQKILDEAKEKYQEYAGEEEGWFIEVENQKIASADKFNGSAIYNIEMEGLDIYISINREDLLQIIKKFPIEDLIKHLKIEETSE